MKLSLSEFPVCEREAVRGAFYMQRSEYSCAAAAVRHGLLLGGLVADEDAVSTALGVTRWGADHVRIKRALRSEGAFEAEAFPRRRGETTAAFFDRLHGALAPAGFALACIGEGGNDHWICVGAVNAGRIWAINSHRDYGGLLRSFSPLELDAVEWGDEVMLITPRRWAQQFLAWSASRLWLLGAEDVADRQVA